MEPLNRFPHMLQDWLMQSVRAAEQAREARKAAMRTKAAALAYQADLRKKVRRIFGRLPRRTPLKPKVTGVLERDHYRVEKVLFESRPGFPVTGLLYLPKGRRFPQPGVLAPCGHSHNGKAEGNYQSFCQGLVRKGYVVFMYDPISQGERLQYLNADGSSRYGVGVGEHIQAGNQQLLVGEVLATWRIWDGIRALDYLLSRPEVDPRHVGVTGNSGGGTLTTLLVANDDRFTMAAPGCYVTTFRRNAENELPADSEQIPPGLLALGMDTDDLLALHAPKPLILLTQEKDFFDQRGSRECFERLKHLYGLLGAPDNVAMFTGPGHHGYARPLREAMYGFFNRACGKRGESAREPQLRIEPDEQLRVTATGQVDELQPRTVFSFTAEKSRALAARRKRLTADELRRRLTRLLSLPRRAAPPEFRILRHLDGREYPAHGTHYSVQTELGIQVAVTMLVDEAFYSRPPRGTEAVLYVPHQSADEDLREEPLAKELAAGPARFFAVDVRGIGESRPNTCGVDQYRKPYGSDYFYSSYGILLGQALLGGRTHDVLSVTDLLAEYGYRRIHLAGRGWGSLPALFAAVLDDRVGRVTLKNAPRSYSEIAEAEDYAWPLSSLLPGVLQHLDLRDCHRALGRKLSLIEPWDSAMQPPAPP